MATVTSAFQSVAEHGWRRGFPNLLAGECHLWWGTRKWLIHLLVWLAIANGIVALVALGISHAKSPLSSGPDTTPDVAYQTEVQVFFQLGLLSTAIGVITTLQGAIIGEKQLGTAAWVLSKPVSRSAFVLSKLAANGAGFLVLAVALPSLVFYGEVWLLAGRVPQLGLFLAGVGVWALHVLFYVALILMLGTLFSTCGPVAGIALGCLLGGSLLVSFFQVLAAVTPWKLSDLAMGLVLGSPLPAIWPVPIVATALWTVLFISVALWRFAREEF